MTDAELNEIKLFLRKVQDICKFNNDDDLCNSCPFAIQKGINYYACAVDDVPEFWLIDKMKGNK